MKRIVLFSFLTLLLISCSKDDNQDTPDYLVQDLNAIVLQPTSVNPPNNARDHNIDVDGDLVWDFKIAVYLYQEVLSPHSEYTTFYYSEIVGRDSTCQVAINTQAQFEIELFQAGEDVDGNSLFLNEADISSTNVYISNTHYGDLFIGIRKKTGNGYRYGYISLNSQGAKITLYKSVFNRNQNHCKIEVQQ